MIVGILGVGFLGSQIASYLEYEGITPLLISRDKNKVVQWQNEKAQAYLLKPQNRSSWQELLSLCDKLVITVAPTEEASYEETYLKTAHALAKTGINKPFYYCSSTSVYGDKQGGLVDEDSLLTPLSSSDKILIETEKVYLKLGGSIVRIGELWGFEKRIENRLKTHRVLPGDGSMMTNLTHVTDAARAFVFLIKGEYTGIFNVCGNFHVPRKVFYDDLARCHHFPPPLWDPSKKAVHSGNKIVSSEKIRRLGFTFHHEDYV